MYAQINFTHVLFNLLIYWHPGLCVDSYVVCNSKTIAMDWCQTNNSHLIHDSQ